MVAETQEALWEQGEAAWFRRKELETLYGFANKLCAARGAHLVEAEAALVKHALEVETLRIELIAACDLVESLAMQIAEAA